MLRVIMLSVPFFYNYTECHYAECHCAKCCYAECRYAECRYAECRYAECLNARKAGLLSMMRLAGKFNRYAILWCSELYATRLFAN